MARLVRNQSNGRTQYPEVLARCEARREFMRSVLGFELSGDVLPLTNLPGVISPYLLNLKRVVALRS